MQTETLKYLLESDYMMETYIFRHGETNYQQGKVNIDEAHDLTSDGIRVVKNSTNNLANKLKHNHPILISSSPFGRCLHTSKIIKDCLNNKVSNVVDIDIDNNLGEVENFKWDLFYPLVIGGHAEYNGDRFIVNKSLTNPQNASPIKYFRDDSTHNLSPMAKKTLPSEYAKKISEFEKYSSVIGRLNSKLDSLKDSLQINILSTHEGLTGELIKQISKQDEAFLNRGKYFGVETQNGLIIPYNCQEDAISTSEYK